MKNCKKSLQKVTEKEASKFNIIKTKESTEISIYPNIPVTPEQFATETVRIKATFPELQKSFFMILQDRVIDKKISSKRLRDAVDSVIDSHVWSTSPRIASFLEYDKKIQFYDYQQIIRMNDDYSGKVFDYFSKVELSFTDKILYAHNSDIDKFNLKLYIK